MIGLLVVALLQVAGEPAPTDSAVTTPPTEASSAADATTPAAPQERRVLHCRTEMVTGSHEMVRVCRTAQQENSDRRDAADLQHQAASLPLRQQDLGPGAR